MVGHSIYCNGHGQPLNILKYIAWWWRHPWRHQLNDSTTNCTVLCQSCQLFIKKNTIKEIYLVYWRYCLNNKCQIEYHLLFVGLLTSIFSLLDWWGISSPSILLKSVNMLCLLVICPVCLNYAQSCNPANDSICWLIIIKTTLYWQLRLGHCSLVLGKAFPNLPY
jgi:hypothetical protein